MSRKHMIAIGAFVLAFGVASYLGFALLIKPVNREIAARAIERDDAEKKLQEAKSKAAQYDKFKAQAENIRRDLNLISQRLDPEFSYRERNRLLSRFYSISSLKVSVALVLKREISKDAGFSSLEVVPFSVDCEGGYHEIGNFLNSVIEGQRMMVPNSVDISQSLEQNIGGSTVKAKLSMSLFLEKKGAAK